MQTITESVIMIIEIRDFNSAFIFLFLIYLGHQVEQLNLRITSQYTQHRRLNA